MVPLSRISLPRWVGGGYEYVNYSSVSNMEKILQPSTIKEISIECTHAFMNIVLNMQKKNSFDKYKKLSSLTIYIVVFYNLSKK